MKIGTIFSKKNLNLVLGFVSLLLFLWIIMYAVPSLFAGLFNTLLGNFLLLGLVILASMYDPKIGFDLSIVLIVVYQFAHMTFAKK